MQLCSELRLDNICRNIRNRHKFTHDFHAILTDLIYARILSPSSKMSSYSFCHTLLEPPKYSLQNMYLALSVMTEESNYYFKIEENFRIMKSDFEAKPVYVQRNDRIKAHFLTCYISLLVYRLLEKKLEKGFTCNQILETLRGMNMTLLSKKAVISHLTNVLS